VVGISNFPLISSIRTLSLCCLAVEFATLSKQPLSFKAPKTLAPSIHPTEPSTLRSLHRSLVAYRRRWSNSRIGLSERNSRRRKPSGFSLAPLEIATPRSCLPSLRMHFWGKRARYAACRGILKRDISERRRRDAHARIFLNISFCTPMCFPYKERCVSSRAITFTIDKKVIKTRQKYYSNCHCNNPPRNIKCIIRI